MTRQRLKTIIEYKLHTQARHWLRLATILCNLRNSNKVLVIGSLSAVLGSNLSERDRGKVFCPKIGMQIQT